MMLNMYSTENTERNLHSKIQSKGKNHQNVQINYDHGTNMAKFKKGTESRSYVLKVVQLVSKGGQCSSQRPIAVLAEILLIASRMLFREPLDIMVKELPCKNRSQQFFSNQTIQLIAILQP